MNYKEAIGIILLFSIAVGVPVAMNALYGEPHDYCANIICRIDGDVVFSGDCDFAAVHTDHLYIEVGGEVRTWVYGGRPASCVRRMCEP